MPNLEDWERVYRQWKTEEVPPPSCSNINSVQDYLFTWRSSRWTFSAAQRSFRMRREAARRARLTDA